MKATKKTTCFRLDTWTLSELELAAQMEGTNVSAIIRRAIESHLFDIGGDLELYAEQVAEHNRNEHLLNLLRDK